MQRRSPRQAEFQITQAEIALEREAELVAGVVVRIDGTSEAGSTWRRIRVLGYPALRGSNSQAGPGWVGAAPSSQL